MEIVFRLSHFLPTAQNHSLRAWYLYFLTRFFFAEKMPKRVKLADFLEKWKAWNYSRRALIGIFNEGLAEKSSFFRTYIHKRERAFSLPPSWKTGDKRLVWIDRAVAERTMTYADFRSLCFAVVVARPSLGTPEDVEKGSTAVSCDEHYRGRTLATVWNLFGVQKSATSKVLWKAQRTYKGFFHIWKPRYIVKQGIHFRCSNINLWKDGVRYEKKHRRPWEPKPERKKIQPELFRPHIDSWCEERIFGDAPPNIQPRFAEPQDYERHYCDLWNADWKTETNK